MARRNWSNAYKTELLTAYARIVRKNSNTLTVVGTDAIANRAHFLHQAQEEVCCDPDLKREITAAFATMFLRKEKSILESVRSRVDLQMQLNKDRAQEAEVEEVDDTEVDDEEETNTVAFDTETKPLAPFEPEPSNNDAELATGEGLTIVNAPANYPIVGFARQTVNMIESVKALVEALQPLTSVQFDEIIADVVKAAAAMQPMPAPQPVVEVKHEPAAEPEPAAPVASSMVYQPEPSAFSGRKPGELRIVFDAKPSVIVAGFSPALTQNVISRFKGILPYTRAQYSALMQCLVEHPDASVLILADTIKVNPRIEYLTRALEIQILQVSNTREGLDQAIDHVNGYVLKKNDTLAEDVRPPVAIVTDAGKEAIAKVTGGHVDKTGTVVVPAYVSHTQSCGIPKNLTVGELGKLLGEESQNVIKQLVSMGHLVTDGQVLDQDHAREVATGLGYDATPELDDEEEEDPDPDFIPANRRVVFITHNHFEHERKEIRLRFVKYLDVRYCDVGELHQVLVGHKYPAVLHYASIPPAQAADVIKLTQATLYYVRSGYMDAFGKLAELEASIKSQ